MPDTRWIQIGDAIVIVDDLITKAHSKLEAARALRAIGCAVQDVLVLVDREQGGREELAASGLMLHAAWRLSELLGFYRDHRFISSEKYKETMAYLAANR